MTIYEYKAGDLAQVFKYGHWYEASVVRTTPTRALVRFRQKSGRTVERWVPKADVR